MCFLDITGYTRLTAQRGPILFQDGDYYGQTVNVASRIAEFARPGEVVVSQAVVDATGDEPIAFADVGMIELKGVSEPIRLHVAHLE